MKDNNKITFLNDNFHSSDILRNFRQYLIEYKTIAKDRRGLDILFKLHGINNNIFTLEEIGSLHEITKQRTAQIKDKELENIKALIEGNDFKKPFCNCNKDFVNQLDQFKQLFDNANIISYKTIESLLLINFHISILSEDKKYINLLLNIYGYENTNFYDEHIYFKRGNYTIKNLKFLITVIFKVLEKHIYPLDTDSIIIKTKSRIRNVPNSDIYDVLTNFSIFERIEKSEKAEFQLRIDKLSTAGDMGNRILFEKNSQMHFNDILAEINQRLIFYKSQRNFSAEAIKADFMKNGKVKAIGKSGLWALKEWGTNTATISSLIRESFLYFNKPLTNKEILNYINTKRTDISIKNIRANMSVAKDSFLKIDNGQWILKEWSPKYKRQIISDKSVNSSYSYDQALISNTIIQIFESNYTNKMEASHLREELLKRGINFKTSSYNAIITKLKIIKRDAFKSRYLVLLENHREIISKIQKDVKKTFVYENLKLEINKIIFANKDIKRSQLVKQLVKQFHFSKPTIYSVLSKENILFNVEDRISRTQDPTGQDLNKLNVSEFLKARIEDKNLELKSSLHWSYKENRIDKNLEFEIIKTIAAFLNTQGGKLFIGVDDKKNILGIDNDLKILKKMDKDGFSLKLNDIIDSYFPGNIHDYIEFYFPKHEEKLIFICDVRKYPRPIFIKKDNKQIFFIRANAATKSLDHEATHNYIKDHWPEEK